MTQNEQRIDEEAAALWKALHGVPPPKGCSGAALIDLAIRTAEIADYQRLQSPWLRDRNLVWPVDKRSS